MTLNELKKMASELDDDDEMEYWMIEVINDRISINDWELEELLDCNDNDEVYGILEEQYNELQPEEVDE